MSKSNADYDATVPSDLVEALKALPLFPLQQVVLFPGMLLPLEVFEPRYCALVRDVLANHRAFAVPLVSDANADLSGRPPFEACACVGTVVDAEALPRGRFRVVLLGRARVTLQELAFVPPYRRALATIMAVRDLKVPPLEMARMHQAAAAFVTLVKQRESNFKLRLPKGAPDSAMIDAYAHQLIIDPTDRQAVLSTTSVRARAQRVTEVMTIQRAALGTGADVVLN